MILNVHNTKDLLVDLDSMCMSDSLINNTCERDHPLIPPFDSAIFVVFDPDGGP